jgi:isoaspartyl peptidase/L-asparaginase-like protein (Ntn-hydrolase superfamily)
MDVFMITTTGTKPIMLATWSFGQPAIAAGWDRLISGGTSLDAVEAACRQAEADVNNRTVGVAGYPDRDGNVSLDACIMLSPARCGSVCAVKTVPHPITLARRVMEKTPHKMLAGAGADQFALEQGIETGPLLTEETRQKWIEWKAGQTAPVQRPVLNIEESHDTIGVLGLDANGVLAGGCTTSGWAYKLPGRVGDSPTVGHGLYVDPSVGCCVCTGHGELVMGICGSFVAVETLRRGGKPIDAVNEVLRRLQRCYALTDRDQIGVIVLNAGGEFSTGSLRPGYQTAVRTPARDELVSPDVVLFGAGA